MPMDTMLSIIGRSWQFGVQKPLPLDFSSQKLLLSEKKLLTLKNVPRHFV